MPMTYTFDKHSQELIIRTEQGIIVINECLTPKLTRVVLSPNAQSFVSMSEGKPSMMVMWAGVPIAVEPLTDKDDTKECPVAVYDDIDVRE